MALGPLVVASERDHLPAVTAGWSVGRQHGHPSSLQLTDPPLRQCVFGSRQSRGEQRRGWLPRRAGKTMGPSPHNGGPIGPPSPQPARRRRCLGVDGVRCGGATTVSPAARANGRRSARPVRSHDVEHRWEPSGHHRCSRKHRVCAPLGTPGGVHGQSARGHLALSQRPFINLDEINDVLASSSELAVLQRL